MIQRCTDEGGKDYSRYGGRGINVCDEWMGSYEKFAAYMPPRPPHASIDRIDNNGNYEPGNVRWATPKEQARNMRSNHMIEFQGETMTLVEWSERLNLNPKTLKGRLRRMSVDDALGTPANPRRTITHEGRTLTLAQWSKETGITRKNLYARVFELGWPASKALSTPPS